MNRTMSRSERIGMLILLGMGSFTIGAWLFGRSPPNTQVPVAAVASAPIFVTHEDHIEGQFRDIQKKLDRQEKRLDRQEKRLDDIADYGGKPCRPDLPFGGPGCVVTDDAGTPAFWKQGEYLKPPRTP